jgi:hypothetical protein
LVGSVQQSDEFIGGSNIKRRHPSVVEPILNRIGWIEQLQFNLMIVCPPLEVRQHSQAATLNRIYVGEFDYNDPRIPLREDSVTQTVSSFTLDNAPFALDNSHVTDYLDMYVEHGLPPHTATISTNEAVRRSLVICAVWGIDSAQQGENFDADQEKMR